MKKNIFFATALVAGLCTIGFAQYSATKNNGATSMNTVIKANDFNNHMALDTVPKKDTVPSNDTSSTKP